jgi:hypothetical protein
VGYLVAILIVVVGGAAGLGYLHVLRENRPGSRPSLVAARRAVRRSVIVAPGDLCLCGGRIDKSGKTSPSFGELLGCEGCNRSWTMDGRRIIRRRPRGQRPTPQP